MLQGAAVQGVLDAGNTWSMPCLEIQPTKRMQATLGALKSES